MVATDLPRISRSAGSLPGRSRAQASGRSNFTETALVGGRGQMLSRNSGRSETASSNVFPGNSNGYDSMRGGGASYDMPATSSQSRIRTARSSSRSRTGGGNQNDGSRSPW